MAELSKPQLKMLHEVDLANVKLKMLQGNVLTEAEVKADNEYVPVPLWTAVPTGILLNGTLHKGRA